MNAAKDFWDRTSPLLAPHGMIGRAAIATGLSRSAFERMRKDGRTPTVEQVKSLAQLWNVKPDWLAFGSGTPPLSEQESKMLDAYRRLEGEPDLTAMILSIPHPHKSGVMLQLKPPEMKRKPVNRRHEIPVFKIHKRELLTRPSVGVPNWLGLAAGEGRELGLCEELLYFDEKDNFKGMHTAQIRGDSMIETLYDGDIIVLKPYPSGGITLPALESADHKSSLFAWQNNHDVREGYICVLSINDEPPTLKRVHYDKRRGEKNWKLQIVADNPDAFETFQADHKDKVTFYAKLVARAE